jgi:hypothetical protein
MASNLRVAVIVAPDMPLGLVANSVGVIAVGLGAQCPELADSALADGGGRGFGSVCNQPMPVLQADRAAIRDVMLKAFARRPEGATIVPFPAFARSIHVFADYEKALGTRSLDEEEIDGIGLAGPSAWIKSLTGSLKLLR